MVILSGILNHAVLQRNAENICNTVVTGLTHIDSAFSIYVRDAFEALIPEVVLDEVQFTQNEKGYAFQMVLKGIPLGGPYAITLIQENTLVITDVYVGDLYALAGQSNMEGIGLLCDRKQPETSTRAYYMDGHWGIAEDPLHDLPSASDLIHQHINGGTFEARNPRVGTGPGVAFGQYLSQTFGIPVGLIPCAHGGTNMNQWSPEYEANNGYGLYHMLINRIQQVGGHIKGLVWYQGCSDTDVVSVSKYAHAMTHFISTLRTQTRSDLPIVMVQIARICSHETDATYWNAIQNEQLKLAQTVKHLEVVASIDLEMDDFIHISGISQDRLATRCAKAMIHLLQETYTPQPTLESVHLETTDGDWNATIVLNYKHVVEALSAPGRAYGFTLTHMDTGADQNYIYRVTCVGNQILIKTTESEIDLSQSMLHYGKGFMPYCNIVDGEDRAIPVFTDFPLSSQPLTSLKITKAWLSNTLNFNAAPSTFKDFGYYFLNAHPWFESTDDACVYHIPFDSLDDETIDIRFGGGGDFSVYLDQVLIESFALTAPIHPNQHRCLSFVSVGRHLLSVVYKASAHPKGIFMRFVSTKAALNTVLIDPQSL